jgi:hypothetical protein
VLVLGVIRRSGGGIGVDDRRLRLQASSAVLFGEQTAMIVDLQSDYDRILIYGSSGALDDVESDKNSARGVRTSKQNIQSLR